MSNDISRRVGGLHQARKARRCDVCDKTILAGERYFAIQGRHGGDPDFGPHSEGWWQMHQGCAQERGWMAPVMRAGGLTWKV